MKRLFWYLNILLALATLVIYGLHYFPPSSHSFLLGATLFLPVCLAFNLLFVIYWLLKVNKKLLLSALILLLGIHWVKCYIAINPSNPSKKDQQKPIRIASYNAHYLWYKGEKKNIYFQKEFKEQFLDSIQPDILFFQEGTTDNYGNSVKSEFLYHFTISCRNSIYSKYPILNSKSIELFGTKNRCIYSDLKIKEDTLRIYNIHLSSFKYPKTPKKLAKEGVKNIYKRLGTVFKTQEKQIDVIASHIKESPYPVIICGDLNNLSNSYQYRKLTKEFAFKDTFIEAGNGLGTTYDFSYFPLRIDYIFVPKSTKVLSHKVFKTENWSDHYPIVSEIEL